MTTINAVGTTLSGQTGTGTFVGANTPTLITPNIGAATATSLKCVTYLDTNGITAFTTPAATTPVNYLTFSNSATGNSVRIDANGSDSNIGIIIAPKGTGAIGLVAQALTQPLIIYNGTSAQHSTTFTFANTAQSRTITFPDSSGNVLLTGLAINSVPSITFSSTSGIIGTTTNDNAAAGSVGEVISSQVLAASAVSLTSTVKADVTSISLTAGDWDVWGNVGFTGNNATIFALGRGWINNTSATPSDQSLVSNQIFSTSPALFTIDAVGFVVPGQRLSLSTTTTIYLSVEAIFGVSTCSAYGTIYARRRR